MQSKGHRKFANDLKHNSDKYKMVTQCGEGQTDTQTLVTNIHFASSTIHAKCNNYLHF